MEERQTNDRKIDDCMNELMNSIVSAETEIPQVESAFKETAATKTQLEAEFKQAQVDRAEAKAGLVHRAESVARSAATLDVKGRVARFKVARDVRAEIAWQADGAAPTIAELIAHIAEEEEEARKLVKEKEEDKEEEPGPAHKWQKMS